MRIILPCDPPPAVGGLGAGMVPLDGDTVHHPPDIHRGVGLGGHTLEGEDIPGLGLGGSNDVDVVWSIYKEDKNSSKVQV